MQPTIQTDQDKMVPIDTSGESVEIELKEDEKKKEEVSEEPTVEVEESKQTKSEDELDEYSVSVKRRIDKLTKKMREAERREQAAIEYAEKIKKQNEDLEAKTKELDTGYTAEFKERVNTQSEVIKDNLKRALASKDNDAVVKAQEQLAQIALDQQRLKEAERLLEQANQNTENKEVSKEIEKPKYKKPDPRAEQWAEDNEWFGKDEVMTYAAFGIHKRLIEQEGLDPSSEEYYKSLDAQMRTNFPQKFEDSNKSNRVVQTVASANRSTKSGRRTVKLTPSQVAIAKKLGVPLEEYAPSSLDAPEPPEGFHHRWVRAEYRGQQDEKNVMGRLRSGYELVMATEYPDRMDLPSVQDGKYKGVIGVGGLILMRCPIEVKEDRDAYFAGKTSDQQQSVENDLHKDEHPSMPIHQDRQSRVTFGGKKSNG